MGGDIRAQSASRTDMGFCVRWLDRLNAAQAGFIKTFPDRFFDFAGMPL